MKSFPRLVPRVLALKWSVVQLGGPPAVSGVKFRRDNPPCSAGEPCFNKPGESIENHDIALPPAQKYAPAGTQPPAKHNSSVGEQPPAKHNSSVGEQPPAKHNSCAGKHNSSGTKHPSSSMKHIGMGESGAKHYSSAAKHAQKAAMVVETGWSGIQDAFWGIKDRVWWGIKNAVWGTKKACWWVIDVLWHMTSRIKDGLWHITNRLWSTESKPATTKKYEDSTESGTAANNTSDVTAEDLEVNDLTVQDLEHNVDRQSRGVQLSTSWDSWSYVGQLFRGEPNKSVKIGPHGIKPFQERYDDIGAYSKAEDLGWPWERRLDREDALSYITPLCCIVFYVGVLFYVVYDCLSRNGYIGEVPCCCKDPHHHLCNLCFCDFVFSIVIAFSPQAYIFIDVTDSCWGKICGQLDMYKRKGDREAQEAEAFGHFKVNPFGLGSLLVSYFLSMIWSPFRGCAFVGCNDRQDNNAQGPDPQENELCEVPLLDTGAKLKINKYGACMSFVHCCAFANSTTNRIKSRTGETNSVLSITCCRRSLFGVLDSCFAFWFAELSALVLEQSQLQDQEQNPLCRHPQDEGDKKDRPEAFIQRGRAQSVTLPI